MASETDIANLAIRHLGIGLHISDIDTDTSAEAQAARTFYDQARDEALRDFRWPFATKIATLALVEEFDGDTDEWAYSYRYPSDCIDLRRLKSGSRTDARDTRAAYKITSDDDGLLILTDYEDAEAEYTSRFTVTGYFPPDFVQALACLMAFYMAPSLAAGNANYTPEKLWAKYQWAIGRAQSNAGNEEQLDEPPDSELIRTRE